MKNQNYIIGLFIIGLTSFIFLSSCKNSNETARTNLANEECELSFEGKMKNYKHFFSKQIESKDSLYGVHCMYAQFYSDSIVTDEGCVYFLVTANPYMGSDGIYLQTSLKYTSNEDSIDSMSTCEGRFYNLINEINGLYEVTKLQPKTKTFISIREGDVLAVDCFYDKEDSDWTYRIGIPGKNTEENKYLDLKREEINLVLSKLNLIKSKIDKSI